MDVGGTPVRALAYPALTGAPEPGDQVLLNTGALELGLGTGGYALVIAVPGRLPSDGPARPPGQGALHAAAGAGGRGRRAGLAPPRGAARRRRPGRDARRGGRPALRAAGDPRRLLRGPRPGRAAGRGLRDARRRRAARVVLPHGRRAARRRLAGRHGDHRPVLRRRPGGRHRAQRPAGRPARARRRAGRRHPGAGQPGHRHPVGLLRRGRRRGGQRGRRAGRRAGGVAAGQRRPTRGSGTAASRTTA